MAPLIWSFAFNIISLLVLLVGINYAAQFQRKPLLAWEAPLHLSYQRIGTVSHSRVLALYDAELWNLAVQVGGGIIAAITVVTFLRGRRDGPAPLRKANPRMKTVQDIAGGRFNINFNSKIGLSTILACISLGSQLFSNLLGMHPATWTTTSPIRAVSTAAITAELTRVPAATPWDMSSVMLRSAFERVLSQKGHGALDITHRYLSRHLQEGEGVRVGKTVYPSTRTHGVGVAPAPWERRGYRVPVEQGRVLSYEPIVAATNVTVQCVDATEDWGWGYEVHQFPSTQEPKQPHTIAHRFHVYPKENWKTRGPNRTVTYFDDDEAPNLETWMALRRHGTDSESANDMQIHQLFLFTNVDPIHRQPQIIMLDCVYGGVDLIRQVVMTSPLAPISIGDVLDTKGALDMEDLYPAASAVETSLGRDGGAMVAGMAAGTMTSLEMWEYLEHRTLKLHELLENVLVDTAQAYFSLVRQWREESQFFSWPRDVAPGQLVMTTRKIGWDGGAGVGGLAVLGLLALLPLTRLVGMSRSYVQSKRLSERFELKDGVIKRKSE